MVMIPDFVGVSNFSKNLNGILKSVSSSTASVLLEGERGTGKRLYAQKIHCEQSLGLKFFYEINCRILSDVDIHYLLEKVISTDFINNRCTVFVNNIEYMSFKMQEEFLNFFHALHKKHENSKVITASSVVLDELTKRGKFNKDLFFQLSVVKLNFLPLRQRKEDIIPIANYYFQRFKKDSGFNFSGFTETAIIKLNGNVWNGNCDELINCIQRGFIVGKNSEISEVDLAIGEHSDEEFSYDGNQEDKSLKTAMDNFKKIYVTKILEETGWNQTKAAKILGIQRTYVIKLINELGIRDNK